MPTITGIATGDARFTILVKALQAVDAAIPGSNLVTTLNTAGANLTVFAPTDAAFTQLAKDRGYTGSATNETAVANFLVTDLGAATIKSVLLYHVSDGAKTLAQISKLATVDTLNGATIKPDGVTLVDKEPDLIDASLVQTNVKATNGIVHVIDRVMLPVDLAGNDAPTIAGLVGASGTFDTNGQDFDFLLQAATAAGLVPALNNASADLTVLAPTDAAFLKLAGALGFDGTSEADGFAYLVDALTLLSGGLDPIPLLGNILKYHVLPESLQASQILGQKTFDTLLGVDLKRSGTTLVDLDPDVANPRLIKTDIQTANGVVHVINGVLLPADLLKSNGARDVDFVIGKASGEVISTGRDNDFVDGNGGRDVISAGSGRDVVLGGSGGDVIFGGTGNDRLVGGAGDDYVSGGTGRDRIGGSSGDDLLRGGLSRDVFVFHENSGDDVILDFQNGFDRVKIATPGIDAFADLDISRVGGVVTIDLGGGDTVAFAGIKASVLDASDFIFT